MAVLLSVLKTSSQRTVATPPVAKRPRRTRPTLKVCWVVRAAFSPRLRFFQGMLPVSFTTVTARRREGEDVVLAGRVR